LKFSTEEKQDKICHFIKYSDDFIASLC